MKGCVPVNKKMFKKILVAVDGSENSTRAADRALILAQTNHAHAYILNVVPIPDYIRGESFYLERIKGTSEEGFYLEMKEKIRQEHEKLVVDVSARYAAAKVENTSLVKIGHVPETICETAEDEKIDLIVLGSRGLSDMARALLGSVSNYVVTHAACSVLVVK